MTTNTPPARSDLWAVWQLPPGRGQVAHIILPRRRTLCGLHLGTGPLRSSPDGARRCDECERQARRCAVSGLDTRQRAEAYVTDALGDHAEEHDVPAITDELHGLAGSWDVSQVDTDRFWTVVQAHALAGREASGPNWSRR